MPKAGWAEMPFDECPMCGKHLPEPDEWSLLFVFDPDYNKFTGAISTPVCCKVWLTWRSSDELWHYELPDNIQWKHRGGADHELNRKYHRGYVLPERRGRDSLPESVRQGMQKVEQRKDHILEEAGRLPQFDNNYDF